MNERINKLSIKLNYCYGIGNFNHDFSYYGGNTPCKVHLIYAANGIMKSSFTKTFQSLQNNNPSEIKDHINNSVKSNNEIYAYNEDGKKQKILSAEICAIPSFYDQNQGLNGFVDNSSKHATSLLVDPKLKNEFDTIYTEIKDKEIVLLKSLAILSRLKEPDLALKEILEVFNNGNVLELLIDLRDKLELYSDDLDLYDLDYSIIFATTVLDVIDKDPNFQQKLDEYLERYNQLIQESRYFREGVFDLINQEDIQKTLEKNKFFQAEHSLYLHDKTQGSDNRQVFSLEEMQEVFNEEYFKIINEKELKKRFEEIKKILNRNPDLRNFKTTIERKRREGKDILHLLSDCKKFKQQTWLSYLKKNKDELNSLLDSYLNNKDKLEQITQAANSEIQRWKETIEEFQKRFNTPFTYQIENISDSVLGKTLPQLKTVYVDVDKKETPIALEQLKNILSTGELRAFYILNILFEIEYRRKNKQRTLFIFDDVADSFDYKNKYAIVEYLSEILEEEFFYGIILTHNFDFFRTLKSRLKHRKAWIADKKEAKDKDHKLHKIELNKADREEIEPFSFLRDKLSKGSTSEAEFVCMIPFVRNLIEYSKGENDSEYIKLTALLHIKKTTRDISFLDIVKIYMNVFGLPSDIKFESINLDARVIEAIYKLANERKDSNEEGFRIGSKLILSVASRLKTEEYMINKIEEISGEPPIIAENQFGKLFQTLLDKVNENKIDLNRELKIIKSVNLITPEHIHINSFMFEPILDMSFNEIKNIYNEVSNNLSIST